MRGKLLGMALVVSLAANLFFVFGVLYSSATAENLARSEESRLDYVSERLALTKEQRQTLVELQQQMRERRKAGKERRQQRRQAFLEAVAKPTFDRDQVAAAVSKRCAARSARMVNTAEDLHGFLQGLSDGQKQDFLELARERGFLRGLLFARSPHRKGT